MTARSLIVRLVAMPLLAVSVTASVVVVPTMLRYAAGTERVPSVGSGYPSREAGNLDRELRVFPEVDGCSGSIVRSVARRFERATFTELVRAFGPMKGTYRGPYPTREEATDALRSRTSSVSGEEWLTGAFLVQGRSVRVSAPAVGRVGPSPDARLNVALVDTCLVVGIERGEMREVHLIDPTGVGWFAVYRYP